MSAQSDTSSKAKHLIYTEILGHGGYGSINYEHLLLNKKKTIFSVRGGISTYQLMDFNGKFNPDIQIPVMLNGLYGNEHKIEFGIGEVFSTLVLMNLENNEPIRNLYFHTGFAVGYRLQKNTGGFVLRCNYTPFFEFNSKFRNWASISIGYLFKSNK